MTNRLPLLPLTTPTAHPPSTIHYSLSSKAVRSVNVVRVDEFLGLSTSARRWVPPTRARDEGLLRIDKQRLTIFLYF